MAAPRAAREQRARRGGAGGGRRDGGGAGGGRRGGGDAAAPARRRKRGGGDLGARLAVAIPAAGVALFFVIVGGPLFIAFLAVMGVICLHELYAMYPQAHASRLAGFVSLVALLVVAGRYGREALPIVLVCAVPLTFFGVLAQPRGGAPAVAVTLLGVGWIGLALAHAVMLRDLPHGQGVIIAVCVGTFLGDTGAYIGGRMFGRTPLAPAISPNKTTEGLVIGFVVGALSVWFAGLYQDWMSGTDAILLGAAVAFVAPIGDLFESYLKRDAGTKDTGTLFGAHGGALDRLDAILFTAVIAYYIWQAML